MTLKWALATGNRTGTGREGRNSAADMTPVHAPDRDLPRTATAFPDCGFGLYVHWPFCRALCPYCDFNSHVRETVDHARWQAALLAELDHYASLTKSRRLTSVFFGGGTPSLMQPATVAAVIERATERWGLTPDAEITLEANPTSADAARFRDFAAAGVNRLSVGVQALDDASLAALGRRHDAAQARAALQMAAAAVPRFTFDLIYARPGQTVAAWRRELRQALTLAGEHLSAYQLTMEPGTPMHAAWSRGELALPDEDLAAALYEVTQETLDTAGLPAYEVSNHARPGEESRHNLVYWRYDDYVGVGPGAHGRPTIGGVRRATRQHRAPEIWLERVETHGHATRVDDPLPAGWRRDEMLMMGLRLREGVARARFEAETGTAFEAALDRETLARLVDGGFLEIDARALRPTSAGLQRLNAVLAMLLSGAA